MRYAPLLCLTILGCGVARRPVETPAPAPAPGVPESAPAPRVDAREGPWAYAWRAGTYAYAVASDATIELKGDTLPAEQVRTTTYLRYTLSPGDGGAVSVSGLVDSVVVEAQGTSGRVAGARTQALVSPVSFSARLDAARRRVDFPPLAGSTCASAAERTASGAALVVARDLLVPLPPSLARRAEWRDTVTSTVCRGDVPIATTALRTYTVEGMDEWEGAPAIRVRRTSDVTLAGGRGGRAPATLEGTGTATQRLFFDPAGRLLGATGDASADLRLIAGESSGQLKQKVRTRVTLLGAR